LGRLLLAIAILCQITMSACISSSETLDQADTFYIYIAPDGNDLNSGAADLPLKTLMAANEYLMSHPQDCDVIVRAYSDRGIYENQTVEWTYYNADYHTTIQSYPDGIYAHFRADDFNPPDHIAFFRFGIAAGEPTRIVLKNLLISNYVYYVIAFVGDREDEDSGWNGYNIIDNCIIRDAGNLRMPDFHFAYGGIGIVNSRYNTIRDCTLEHLSNAPRDYHHLDILPIIGIYFAHYSSHNSVYGCTFSDVNGHAIRLRDFSNENIIRYNYFHQSGIPAVVSSWYCIEDCTKQIPECHVYENLIADNIIRGDCNCDSGMVYEDLQPGAGGCCQIQLWWQEIYLENNTILPCYVGDDSKKDLIIE